MITGLMNQIPDALVYRKPMVSLVIPTLNEAKNLPLVLPYIPLDVVDEVILVDGRSKDNTVEVARQLLPSIKVVMEKTPGKGAALRRGYAESTGEIIVVIDADGSHDPREIPRFIRALMEGADFVKGSRFAPLGGTTDMPRLRKLGNYGFVLITNLLFSQNFTDLCYGFHAFWRHSLDYIDLARVDGFEIDTAIYLQAVRNKLKVIDVPSFEGFRFYGVGKLQTFPDGWRVLRTIFREWFASMRQSEVEPQIGFRGFNHLPALSLEAMVPVTGSGLPRNDTDYSQIQPAMLQRIKVDDYLRDLLSQSSKEELQYVLPQILLSIFEGLGASSGSFMVLNDKMDLANGYVVYGRRIAPATSTELADTLQQGVAGWAVRNRQPVVIQSTSSDPRWLRRSWEEKEGAARSAVVVPFVAGDKVVGVLTLTRPADRRFTERDVERLKQFAVSV